MFDVAANFASYFDLSGETLTNGYIYIGTANTNPETTPIVVYWDQAGTIPAAQPLRTLNGYVVRDGTPAAFFVATDYSITVRDSLNRLIYTLPSAFLASGSVASTAVTAANNVALAALSAADNPIVLRLSYSSIGDSEPVFYKGKSSPPSINSGAGDGGWQIPASDGGHFELIYPIGGVSPRIWGAVGRPNLNTDDYTPLNNMFTYIASLPITAVQDESYVIDGGGAIYCTSKPLLLTSLMHVNVRNLNLKANSGATWVGNNAAADLGVGTNGIITLTNCVSVSFDNCQFNANFNTNVQCLFATGTTGYKLTFRNCTFKRWAATGNGAIVNASAMVTFLNCDFIQRDTLATGWGIQANYTGIGLGFFGTTGSYATNCNLGNTKYPLYVDPTSSQLTFTGNKFFTDVSGAAFSAAIGVRYAGTNCIFVGNTFNLCRMLIEVSASTVGGVPSIQLYGTVAIYNVALSVLAAWVEITTSLISTPLTGINIKSNEFASGGIPTFKLSVTGSGTFIATLVGATNALPASTQTFINAATGSIDLEMLGNTSAHFTGNEDKLGQHYLTGHRRKMTTLSTNYTVANEDCGQTLVVGVASVIVTLPNSAVRGMHVRLVNSTGATFSLVPQAGATLNLSASGITVTANRFLILECVAGTGANASWFYVN